MLIKNNDGSVDRVIVTALNNKNVTIGKNYKLVKFVNKKTFNDTMIGSDIGIHSSGFVNVAVISSLIAISTFILMYISFRI